MWTTLFLVEYPNSLILTFVDQMKKESQKSMVGKLNFFLGFQIQQGETGIFTFQEKYARNLINKFGLNQAKAKRTPAAIQIKVSNADGGKKVDKSLYQSIIRSLLYLNASLSDIVYAIGVCARYQDVPHESHLRYSKWILKYIRNY